MTIVTADRAAVALKDGFLFEELSLGVEDDARVGVVGRNGAGKTTLLRLLSGELQPDRGVVSRKRGLAASVLRQRVAFEPEETLGGFLYAGEAPEIRRVVEYERLLAGHGSHAALDRLHRELEASGSFDLPRRYASLCTELGLPDLDRPMSTFSGGMAKKAAIARCLAPRSDLVLLDEPTNHLDLSTIEWLEAKLTAWRSAFVLVTHDRWFLDSVCDSILELDARRVFVHPGNYSDYLERKAERYAALDKAENRRLANLKIELAWLGRGARARATKSERRKDDIRAMQAAAPVRDRAMDSFSSAATRLGGKIVEFAKAAKAYDGAPVLAPFDFELTAGARFGVVGPNGAGKSTLLGLVAGRIEPDSGRVERGSTVRVALFDQTNDDIDPERSVLDYVREKAELVRLADGTTLNAEQLLERFLFPRDVQGSKLGKLSGGELRRLVLVRLLAEAPNVLLLDEPTNDLDIGTIELLEEFVDGFPGCVLVVSHDRAFLDRVADSLLVLDGKGGVSRFPGRYSDWRASLEAAALEAASSERGKPGRSETAAERGRTENGKRRLTWAERKELGGILDEISALEAEKDALEKLFASAAPDPQAIAAGAKRHDELVPLIESRVARWEELSALEG